MSKRTEETREINASFFHIENNFLFLVYFSTLNSNIQLELLYNPSLSCERIFKWDFSYSTSIAMPPVCFKYDWGDLL